MSFLHHPESSKYCDWRISLSNGCDNSEVFRSFYYIGASLCLLCVLMGIISLFFRKLVLKDSWRSFIKGANLAFLIFCTNPLVFAVQFLMVALEVPRLAAAIFWAFLIPAILISNLVYFSNLVKVLPSSMFLTTNNFNGRWYPTDAQRNLFLFLFYSYLSISHVILLSLAEYKDLQGNKETAERLLKAGLTMTAVNLALYAVCFCAVAISLTSRLQILLNDSKAVTKTNSVFDTDLLRMTLLKMKQCIYVVIFAGIQLSTFLLPLAYYKDFFSNQACSIAYAFIFIVFVPLTTVPTFGVFLYSDIQKIFIKKKNSSRGTNTSKKGEKNTELISQGGGNVEELARTP